MNKNVLLALFAVAMALLVVLTVLRPATKPQFSLFPIENYDQDLSHWIKPNDVPLLSKELQATRFAHWQQHYFGEQSPWNLAHIKQMLDAPLDLKTEVKDRLHRFSNQHKSPKKIGYGVNFRQLPDAWIKRLQVNVNLEQFEYVIDSSSQRAITVTNTHGRELPTEEVHFYNHTYAGQGYPFDNLQVSSIWAGTPLYILGESRHRDFVLVATPDVRAWVKSTDIARVDEAFITAWQEAAKRQLVAITDTQIPLDDEENKLFRVSGYIGMVFPGEKKGNGWQILLPVRDEQGRARIHHALIPTAAANAMPVPATSREFVTLISKLIHRPYGWGGMYFYNDCASELKNLFTPFGVWLPAHSSEQINPQSYPVNTVDLSKSSRDTRLQFLRSKGLPFLTIINDGGHVILYLGTYANPDDPKHLPVALSYQNVWGLEPRDPAPRKDRRSVIGGSVLLPILPFYPEDPGVASDADYNVFIAGFLGVNSKNQGSH